VPELPEVQAHAERLTESFGGAELSGFRAISFTALKTYAPPPDAAVGHPLLEVGRRGKYLLLRFEPVTFVVHLMQGGRLVPDEKQSAKPRGGLCRWLFEDGDRALLLTEAGTEKKAGVWVVDGDPLDQEPLSRLGPDAATIDVATITPLLQQKGGRLHGFLRHQGDISGIGRRLANEICHRAELSPFANTKKLTPEEVERLVTAIHEAIEEGLAYERTRDDMSKSADRPGGVHKRTGEDCPVCGDTIREVRYNAYTVSYCPTCQTDGKVLADNTTSKFLK
jgi:formamidopyrimidine-DNA glycosylase